MSAEIISTEDVPAPFPGNRRIWSLWDMLGPYGWMGLILGGRLADTLQVAADTRVPESHPKWREITSGMVQKFLTIVGPVVRRLGLRASIAQAVRIEGMLKDDFTREDMKAALNEMENRLKDELEATFFFHVSPQANELYGLEQPFGPEVPQRFPDAIDDIEGAAKCLALGQGTATVLHLMRVMECGLKALSKSLGIDYAPSWESHLNQIETKLSLKYKNKTKAWKLMEPFYKEVSGDLLTIKYAFRNPTMHVGRKYAPDEAQEIFNGVKRLMNRLAKELPPAKIRKKRANP